MQNGYCKKTQGMNEASAAAVGLANLNRGSTVLFDANRGS